MITASGSYCQTLAFAEGWAAGIVFAVGSGGCGVPDVLNSELEKAFGVSMSTITRGRGRSSGCWGWRIEPFCLCQPCGRICLRPSTPDQGTVLTAAVVGPFIAVVVAQDDLRQAGRDAARPPRAYPERRLRPRTDSRWRGCGAGIRPGAQPAAPRLHLQSASVHRPTSAGGSAHNPDPPQQPQTSHSEVTPSS